MLHTVHVPASEAKSLSDEPSWEVGDVNDANYQTQIRRGLGWHNYVASDRDSEKYLEEWITENYPKPALKPALASLRAYPANRLCRTVCALARIELKGFPLDADHRAQIERYLIEILTPVAKAATTKAVVKGPSVQERMKKQLSGVFSDIDVLVDEIMAGAKVDHEIMIKNIQDMGLKAPHLKLITDYMNSRYLNEWNSAAKKEDEQLVEGYRHLKGRKLNQIVKTFLEIIATLGKEVTKIKTQRIIKKKPLDKKKMASKIKFLPEFPELKLTSLDPVDIIGASTLWVYDTKKRKLGYFEAEVAGGLYVKATKVFGFKESCVKILRKPDEQLKHFRNLRKNQTKNWIGTIKAKCGTMTGRTNDDLIILRIDS
jgi:hypothetical protein